MKTPPPSTPSLKGELPAALMLQSVVLVLASMVLDGGGIAQVCFYALLAFWGAVAVLRIRQRGVLTKLDVLLIRYGYIPVCIISFLITRWVWHLRGYGSYL